MTKRMLIDAAHAEETRVVVVDGRQIEELDFESQSLKPLRGNIYLAKVTRVEPGLQAAFVEYGGNRHGFLAFNEIHPDYYQIPVADREALLREDAEEAERDHKRREKEPRPPADEGEDGAEAAREENGLSSEEDDDEDLMEEEVERRRRRLMRRYKIQEVVRRRQIMLVQVVKEERGNKGAALTTYLSLAGRYCVLMPNTARGGGISRKITTATDRKRLKTAAQSLELPPGMGLIIRTAGAKRTKLEIKRDYEYLMRLWENVRDTTLKSIAPALIYEEEDLVKRAIRDMFDKDLDGVWVEGEAGYKDARDFMRMIMPSQAKKVQAYRDPTPLFVAAGVEDQLNGIHSPIVPLKSGGYLVINQTEALVAVDVNSGRSTRERNIEATALKTNLEAAEEATRQLRLRDLAGLIVIDFIDMDEAKNNRQVEKVLKDCLRHDRARIQMGKISPFGLMEISRQRRRSGILEGTTHICSHCNGAGRVRSTESSALSALRAVEMEGVRGGPGAVTVRLPVAVALYILNEKRAYLDHIHAMHGLKVAIAVDEALGHAESEVERTLTREADPDAPRPAPVAARFVPVEIDDEPADTEATEDDDGGRAAEAAPRGRAPVVDESEAEGRRGGRRRRRRGPREETSEPPRDLAGGAESNASEEGEAEDEPAQEGELDLSDPRRPRRRRRGRRGGRRTREEETGIDAAEPADTYAWGTPHEAEPAPTVEVYEWRDTASAIPPPAPQPSSRPASPLTEPPPRRPSPAPRAEGDEVYAWVEDAPSEPSPAPRGARRRRGRGRGGDAEALTSQPEMTGHDAGGLDPAIVSEDAAAAEAVVAQAPEPEAERPGEDPTGFSSGALDPAEIAADNQAEPRFEAANESSPPAVKAPTEAAGPSVIVSRPEPSPRGADPAEVGERPAAPRRGWWRGRG